MDIMCHTLLKQVPSFSYKTKFYYTVLFMYLFNVYLNIYLKTISCLSLPVTHLIYEAEVSYEGFLTQLYKDT